MIAVTLANWNALKAQADTLAGAAQAVLENPDNETIREILLFVLNAYRESYP